MGRLDMPISLREFVFRWHASYMYVPSLAHHKLLITYFINYVYNTRSNNIILKDQ
jgi:hypothetical protein